VELELGEEVAPVGRERLEGCLPLGRERARDLGLLRLRAHISGPDELKTSDDALLVDPPEKASRSFGSDASPLR